jgi:hypothetical protein
MFIQDGDRKEIQLKAILILHTQKPMNSGITTGRVVGFANLVTTHQKG